MQLLLNLQLQARTIIDLKNMITKQQKFIEDYDIVGNSTHDKNLELFLDDGNDQDLNIEDNDMNGDMLGDNLNDDQYPTEQDGQDQPSVGSGLMKNPAVRQSYNGGSQKASLEESRKDLAIMGVPVTQRQGANHNKKVSLLSGEVSQKDTRGLKSKNLKETKEAKEKMEAEFK